MERNNKSKKQQISSLDGFTSSSKKHGKKSDLHKFNTYYSPSNQSNLSSDVENLRIGRVDDFSGVDGFQASGQAPIMKPGDHNKPAEISSFEQDKPLEKEEKKTKKKRFALFHRSKKHADKHAKKHKSKHHRVKTGLKITGVIAAIIILVVGALGLKAYIKTRGILKGGSNGAAALNKNVDPTLLKGEGDGRVNVLLLGKGGLGHEAPDLTDTILVASIDPVAKEVALLSIPRDLWVKSTSSGQSKINAVYANGKSKVLNSYTTKQQTSEVQQKAEEAGITAIEDTVTSVVGIPIHYYAMVDFTAFKQAVDAVGGVDVNVKTQLYDASVAWENNNNPLIAAVGLQHFDGKKALLYSRSRHGSARGDFDRTERQREIILALKSKVLSAGTFANPIKVNSLINAFGNHVSTDFSLNEIMRVYDLVKGVDPAKVQSIGLADPPNDYVTTGMINGQSVVVPRAGNLNFETIKSFVRNTLKDSFLKSENASIMVLNGTTKSGLGKIKADELKSYGYNVTTVADAPTKTYTKTVIVDMTKGVKKYTKNYLEKRLGVTATTTLPDANIVPGTADFVIIVGNNESTSN